MSKITALHDQSASDTLLVAVAQITFQSNEVFKNAGLGMRIPVDDGFK